MKRSGVEALTEREKDTLRLLLAGHDAKSIARVQHLSVHTVNERLRDARAKLSVASSREAARLLAEAERGTPDFIGDKHLGVAPDAPDVTHDEQPQRRRGMGSRLVWFGGGMLIMSLIIAAAVISSVFQGGGGSEAQSSRLVPAASGPAAQSANERAARTWLALVDGARWEESWRGASAMFKSQVTAAQWQSSVQPLRQRLGAVSSRILEGATKTTSLPGAPAGEYEVLQFRTNFAQQAGAVETVVLAREGSDWNVAGYFIR